MFQRHPLSLIFVVILVNSWCTIKQIKIRNALIIPSFAGMTKRAVSHVLAACPTIGVEIYRAKKELTGCAEHKA